MSALVLHWLAALLIVIAVLAVAAGIQEWLIWRKETKAK